MIIEHKYLYYKTLDGFTADLVAGNVSGNSIAFIEDVLLIWTHGTFFCGAAATDNDLSTTSENAVLNKVITAALANKADTDQLKYYSTIDDFNKFADSINTKTNKQKGYFDSLDELLKVVPNPTPGDWAIVLQGQRTVIYKCVTDGEWLNTNQNYDTTIDLTEYVKAKHLDQYIKKQDAQEKLVSGTNIKTINGTSILGSGDMIVGANGVSQDGIKHEFVTQQEYDSMPEHSLDTIYFVYDGTMVEKWSLGDKLPIILS